MTIELLAGSTDSMLGKVRLILEAFEPDEQALSLAELTRRTGVTKASVYRISQELVEWGVLERYGCGYRLGLRLFELGQLVPRQRVLRELAHPYLEELARATAETVHCAVRDGHEVLYVEKLGGYRLVTCPSRTGGRMPLHCTATGKVLLAFAPSRVAQTVLTGPLERRTPRTVVAPGLLRAELASVRANGYALETEETRLGYLSVAAPVIDVSLRVCAAVSVAAPTARAQLARLVPAVRDAAGQISAKLRASEWRG